MFRRSMVVMPGNYVVRSDGSERTLYRVERAAGVAPLPANGGNKMAGVLRLNAVEDGKPFTLKDVPQDQYRLATDEEVAAAEKEDRIPPG